MFTKCLLRHDVVRVFVPSITSVNFCTGHFVMVPLNMTYLHCLQHSLFEHLFNLYVPPIIINLANHKFIKFGSLPYSMRQIEWYD